MSNVKKLMMTAAGGGGLNVEDVFSTYLFNFASAPYTVTNGIDLSGEGGLVWIKGRNSNNHWLHDSERTLSNALFSNLSDAEYSTSNSVTSLNSNGFTVGGIHSGSVDHASWTFRKAPKFFDVVTYTGDGTAGRTISHNLGTTVGMIIVKRLNAGTNWGIYHRSNTSSPQGQVLEFDTGSTASNTTIWNNTAPTSTVFTVGNSPYSNFNGSTYVAYLFAHNDGDGEFGPTGDQDIIKCGSYTATNGTALDVDLGFEPQWVMVKRHDSTGYWWIQDSMRGWAAQGSGDSQKYLQANDSAAEKTKSTDGLILTSTGFTVPSTSGDFNSNGDYIYMAIRRGPMAVPESADEVFKAAYGNASGEPAFTSGFPADFGIWHGTISSSNENRTSTRLTQGKTLDTDSTAAEQTSTAWAFDYQDGFMSGGGGSSNFATMWRRAPNFFDVVCYEGDGLDGRTVSHALGVEPEMIWVKRRFGGGAGGAWVVYNKYAIANGDNAPETDFLALNSPQAVADYVGIWYDTAPTSTQFTLGSYQEVNRNGDNFLAILFASLDGISKLGSYNGNGSSQTIDCGFSSGARFVLIKRIDASGSWNIYDTERGIVAGNDPVIYLDSTGAEVTSYDSVDPNNSGFTVNQLSQTYINASGASYLFYAIA